MLWMRKIFFYVFALTYLVLCPYLVARMLGYVLHPTTHHFVKTGLVVVTTHPADASVFVDGRQAETKSPTVVRDLTPGDHFLRIKSIGYDDWEQKFPVVADQATILSKILLVPEAQNQ